MNILDQLKLSDSVGDEFSWSCITDKSPSSQPPSLLFKIEAEFGNRASEDERDSNPDKKGLLHESAKNRLNKHELKLHYIFVDCLNKLHHNLHFSAFILVKEIR